MVQLYQPPGIVPPDQLVQLTQTGEAPAKMTLGETAQGVTAGWRENRQGWRPLVTTRTPHWSSCSACCIKQGHPMLCSVTDCSAKEGVVETHRARLAAWQEQVLATANFVKSERERLLPRGISKDDPTYAATDVPLNAARQAAGVQENGEPVQRGSRIGRPVNWLVNGWTGGPIKGAFVHLHLSLVGLVDLYTEDEIKAHSPGVLARMQHCLAPTDGRRQEAEALFGAVASRASTGTTGPQQIRWGVGSGGDGDGAAAVLCRRRAAFREAMKISYEAADEQYARVRSLRNTLIIAAAVLTALVGVVCIVGLRFPDAIPLCFHPPGQPSACPSTGGPVPKPGDVSIVALMGILGGAMSATFVLQRLRITPAPISKDLKVSLAFLKLPAGALTAIGGLILIHGRFIPGLTDLDSQGQILAYAIVLGVAQQLVTRFVDQKADDVLAAVPSKERHPMNAPGPNAAGQATGQMTPAVTSTAIRIEAAAMKHPTRNLRIRI